MAYINGFGGTVTFDGATLPVTEWTLDVNAEAIDTTNTGDSGWESNILGAKSWSGSAKAFWDAATVPTGSSGFVAGDRGTISLPAGSSGKSYTGTAQATQVSVGNPVKGAVTFNFNFKGSGSLTYAT